MNKPIEKSKNYLGRNLWYKIYISIFIYEPNSLSIMMNNFLKLMAKETLIELKSYSKRHNLHLEDVVKQV
jgi:hypothetical protein